MMAMTSVPGVRERQDVVHPAQQVHAGRHHGGGVDQGRDRGRALHGVGQPVEQRDLRRLAGGGEEEEEHHRGGRAAPQVVQLPEDPPARAALVLRVPVFSKIKKMARRKPDVTDAVVDEGLLAGRGGRVAVEPVGDQPVRADAHPLPPDEGEQQVVRPAPARAWRRRRGSGRGRTSGSPGRPSCTPIEYRWISALTPVMNMHMVTDSGSTRIPTGTVKPADVEPGEVVLDEDPVRLGQVEHPAQAPGRPPRRRRPRRRWRSTRPAGRRCGGRPKTSTTKPASGSRGMR